MSTNLVTDSGLLSRLAAAAKRGATAQERKQQRVSFVYGNLSKNSSMTRHQVERELERIDKLEGKS